MAMWTGNCFGPVGPSQFQLYSTLSRCHKHCYVYFAVCIPSTDHYHGHSRTEAHRAGGPANQSNHPDRTGPGPDYHHSAAGGAWRAQAGSRTRPWWRYRSDRLVDHPANWFKARYFGRATDCRNRSDWIEAGNGTPLQHVHCHHCVWTRGTGNANQTDRIDRIDWADCCWYSCRGHRDPVSV